MDKNEKLWCKGDLCEIYLGKHNGQTIGIILDIEDDFDLCSVLTEHGIYSVRCSHVFDPGMSTLDFDIEAFIFKMPFIKRIYPSLIANEIISVQPMTVPNFRLFGEKS